MESERAGRSAHNRRSTKRQTCTFESAGWACESTGYLWFAATREPGQYDYPCPQCNTDLFLEKAQKRAGNDPRLPRCPCCNPGAQAKDAYRSALAVVESQAGKFVCN